MSKFTELNATEMTEVNGGGVLDKAKTFASNVASCWVSGCKCLWNSTKDFVCGLFD